MVRSIILVHGAWQGSWAFNAWTPLLEAAGWRVHAVDLPGNGWGPMARARADLDSYVRTVTEELHAIGEPAVLVGHSGGGITVSQVAEALPEQVAALVYLAGMMLPTGLGFEAVVAQAEAQARVPAGTYSGIGPYLEWNSDRTISRVRPAGAMACFLHDCPPEAASRAAGLLQPQPQSGRTMRNHLSPGRFGRVPRIYVECEQDRSVLPALQRLMQQLVPGAKRIALPCGHVPQLACPDALTRLLLPELEALRQPLASPPT